MATCNVYKITEEITRKYGNDASRNVCRLLVPQTDTFSLIPSWVDSIAERLEFLFDWSDQTDNLNFMISSMIDHFFMQWDMVYNEREEIAKLTHIEESDIFPIIEDEYKETHSEKGFLFNAIEVEGSNRSWCDGRFKVTRRWNKQDKRGTTYTCAIEIHDEIQDYSFIIKTDRNGTPKIRYIGVGRAFDLISEAASYKAASMAEDIANNENDNVKVAYYMTCKAKGVVTRG